MNVATKFRHNKNSAQRNMRCLNKKPFLRDVLFVKHMDQHNILKLTGVESKIVLTSTVRPGLQQH